MIKKVIVDEEVYYVVIIENTECYLTEEEYKEYCGEEH